MYIGRSPSHLEIPTKPAVAAITGTFQHAADIIPAQVKWKFVLVYLDDIIV